MIEYKIRAAGLTHDQNFSSTEGLLNAFGKQPRYVWLYRDGAEVQIAMDQLEPLDVIVVNTGEVVPVDGIIA